jgi:hypothetical protein
MSIVSRSIIGSMRGKRVILQDSMIIKGVDALPNSLEKNKGQAQQYIAQYPQDMKKVVLKGCTKMTFDPLRAASHLAAKASCARESLPQLIFVALHAANLRQLLKDVPFVFVCKTLLECPLFVADTLDTGGEAGR